MFKHRAPRRPARREIIVQTRVGSRQSILRNVSATGMILETDGMFRSGEVVSFDLLGRHISARVVSTHSGRVALAFSRPLSERDLKLLYQT